MGETGKEGEGTWGKEAIGRGPSGDHGVNWTLFPPAAVLPHPFSHWTCASEISGRCLRRYIAEQKAYGEVTGFKSRVVLMRITLNLEYC